MPSTKRNRKHSECPRCHTAPSTVSTQWGWICRFCFAEITWGQKYADTLRKHAADVEKAKAAQVRS